MGSRRTAASCLIAAAVCLVAAVTAVARISAGYCHGFAPSIQQRTMGFALVAALILIVIGGVATARFEGARTAQITLASLVVIEFLGAIAILLFYGHQMAHYYDCG